MVGFLWGFWCGGFLEDEQPVARAAEKTHRLFCHGDLGLLKMVPGHTYPRKKGEEVVLLVVDDISRVSLVPLLGVPQPHSAGPGLPSATASQPLTAPVGKAKSQCQGHVHTRLLFSKCFSLRHLHWVRTTATNGASSVMRREHRARASKKLWSR